MKTLETEDLDKIEALSRVVSDVFFETCTQTFPDRALESRFGEIKEVIAGIVNSRVRHVIARLEPGEQLLVPTRVNKRK